MYSQHFRNHDDEVLQPDPNPSLVSGDLVGESQNAIVQSQSGTGTTAAFSLALLNRVNPVDMWCQAIIIVPTAELAVQTGQAMEQMEGFGPDVNISYAIWGNGLQRGAPPVQQQIVIGTPATVRDWCWKLRVIDPQKITVLVVVEADAMMSIQGYMDNCIRINKMLPDDCQRLLSVETLDATAWQFAQRMIPRLL